MIRILLLFLLALGPFAWSSTIVKDSPSVLVIQETGLHPQIKNCDGNFWISYPHVTYFAALHERAVPFLTYNIALPPGSGIPSVHISEVTDSLVVGELASARNCDESGNWTLNSQEHGQTDIYWGPIVERDGVRRVLLGIPMVQGSGKNLSIRKSFRLEVRFAGQQTQVGAGVPGSRALSNVVNPLGARAFFRKPITKVLKRSSADLSAGIEWLLKIPIGDKDLATTLEDGLYCLPFTQMDKVFRGSGLEERVAGIPIGKLTVATGNPDTLANVPTSASAILGPLSEQPIIVLDHSNSGTGAADGIWNDGDTLVFYASGTSVWKASGDSLMPYYFASNVYSHTREYYLGVRTDSKAPRLATKNYSGVTSVVSKLLRYVRAEKDLLLRDNFFANSFEPFDENSGREWFWIWGENYASDMTISSSELSLPQVAELPGLVQGNQSMIAVSYFPQRSIENGLDGVQTQQNGLSQMSEDQRFKSISYDFLVNGNSVQQMDRRLPGGQFLNTTMSLKTKGNQFELVMKKNLSQPDRFDGFSIAYPSTFSWNNQQETWPLSGLQGIRKFSISGAPAKTSVLHISNGKPTRILPVQNGGFSDSISSEETSSLHIFQWGIWNVIADSVLVPITPSSSDVIQDVSNLNGNYDYVIICPNQWLPLALKLKNFREGTQIGRKVKTAVVDLDQIWMHYGSGFPSPQGIRNFLRMARERWSDLRSVLLVGDGHPDYRAIRQGSGGMPIIPPFELEDLGSDDFFGILDSGEAFPYGNYDIDLAVGRLPMNNENEFSIYIQKVEQYESLGKQDLGNWRNTLLMTADDAMQKDRVDQIPDHTKQVESLIDDLQKQTLEHDFLINVQRIYLLNYEADMAYEKPNAAQDLVSQINQGALFTVYFGHGSSTDWADEGLLRPYMLQDVDNTGRYTILGSFACTVGRFDLATSSSLSELFMRAPQKGAIASIGAMRESYPSYNQAFAKALLNQAYLDESPNLGEAYLAGKGSGVLSWSSQRYNQARYVLLGEPVITLSWVPGRVRLDQDIDTLQALQRVKLTGSVDGMAASGKLVVQVLEGEVAKTLSQDIPGKDPYTQDVKYQGKLIHSEILDYKDGKFSTQFITPRKLNFGDSMAQIRVWGWSPGDARNGRGLVKGIRLEGTSPDAGSIVDTVPPEIHFRPCGFPDSLARDFNLGTKVRLEIPACLEVVVKDNVGLDLQEQADEGISFEIDGVKAPWHPFPFLEQSGTRVMTRFRFNTNYQAGDYLFRVSAQDLLGSRTKQELAIELSGSLKEAISGVFNAPNPVGKSGTTFYFRNLAENHTSVVSIQIFGVDGRLVKVIQNAKSGVTRWDGRDQWGRPLANGLYHYVVTCTVYTDGKAKRFKAKQKLVISR